MALSSRLSCFFVSSAVAVVLSAGALSSVWAESADNDNSSASDADQLPEVMVTAEKRTQSFNDVGLTIAAISGDELRERGINSVADLVEVVPGFTFTQSPSETPVYSLRGVGFYDSSLAAYPAVSVYVDQVPLPFPAMTNAAGLDLERVEVLKGPQGTLFGQNSTGGAINYIAAKPTSTYEEGASVTYGRFNATTADAFVSGPVANTLNARLALQTDQGGAWQESYTTPGLKNGSKNDFAGRLLLDWQPSEELKLEANLNGWINHGQSQATQYIGIATPAASLVGIPFAPANDRAASWDNDTPPKLDDTFYQIALRADYALTNNLNLTSLSAYDKYTRMDTVDFGGVPVHDLDDLTNGWIESITQELRIANDSSNRLRWTAGGNYEHDDTVDYNHYLFGASSAGVIAGLPNPDAVFQSRQPLATFAFFGDSDFDVLPNVTLKGGVRYTNTTRKFEGCSQDSGDGDLAAVFTLLQAVFAPGKNLPAVKPGGCTTFLANETQGPYYESLEEDNVSWTVGTDWKVDNDSLLYFNVTKGYKAGSIPTASASTYRQFQPVTQESVLSYEGGYKLQLLDRRLSLDGATFYYDYTNKQLRSKIVDPVFGDLDALVNVPKSKVLGTELSANWLVTRGLTINLSATYLDAQITQFIGINNLGQTANFAGTAMPFTPKWAGTLDAEYHWNITHGLRMFAGADVTDNTKTNAAVGDEPILAIKGYTTLDLRGGVESQDGVWRVMLWGKNVTNEYYWNNVAQTYDTIVKFAAMPATYGITVNYRHK